jgi:hypothetical protein
MTLDDPSMVHCVPVLLEAGAVKLTTEEDVRAQANRPGALA